MNIFEYTDYRSYLKDAYEARRKANPNFSYRFIAARVGFASPGFFTNVLKGKKNISLKLAHKFADLFKLGRKERDYFEALVLFKKAASTSEQREYMGRLLALRGTRIKKLGAEKFEYFEKWYYTAVREAMALHPFRGDYRALATLINPPITVPEAKKAVDVLERLGLVKPGHDGVYERTDAIVSAGDEISKALLNAYQIQAMDLAKRAIDHLPSGTCKFSTLTLSISGITYSAMIEELRAFRRRLLEMAKNCEVPDRIYQMNFHVFPISTVPMPSRRPGSLSRTSR